jgi:hypothetical protein
MPPENPGKSPFASDPQPTSLEGWILPVLLVAVLSGCASGPPGTSYPGAALTLYTREPCPEAQILSGEAQAFLQGAGDYLGLQVPARGLLRIYHYPNRWGLWRHLSREVPSLQWRRGVCYETEQAYIVTLCGNPGEEAFRSTLRHELTHYLVAVHFSDVPPWIDEGLSQVLAAGPPFPHLEEGLLETVRGEARRARKRGCLRLLAVPHAKKLSPSEYRLACALTHYLLTRSPESAPSRVVRFLETTETGPSPERTFSICWGISMEEACEGLLASADSPSGAGGRGSGGRDRP